MSEVFILPTAQENLSLRQLMTDADDVAYFQAVITSREHLRLFEPETVERYQELAGVKTARLAGLADGKFRMGIWKRREDEEEFVGTIRAVPDQDRRGAEIGYWLDVRHTGHGYATFAVTAMSNFVVQRFAWEDFSGQVQLGKAHAWVKEGNDKSIKVLGRAGFIHAYNDNENRLIFEKHAISGS